MMAGCLLLTVMPGLVPGIHAVPPLRRFLGHSHVDGRVKPGHDGGVVVRERVS
jgi:hypothetical protein